MDPEALFVYGSLLFPEVLQAVLRRVPSREPATAPGWRVAALKNRSYPGLVPAQGDVNGMLVTGLTNDEWRVLDAFEEDVYELRRLALSDDRHGWAYVWSDETQAFPHDWDAKEFAAKQLTDYVSACVRWRMRYDAEAAVR